jgi:beta-1,4-mannooligosaccharide/beta-1,4-mannosyl-N-acetylglucosamine phosphorylase
MNKYRDATKVLTRHPANPLIKVADMPGVMQVFNPSPVMYGEKTILLLSVMPFKAKYAGETWVAESDDGIHFKIREKSFINPDRTVFPWNQISEHIIDNRVTKIDDTYYIVTPMMGARGTQAVLGKTMDFESYEIMDVISLPMNRGASLFPEKINGKYYKLDRPGAGDDTSNRGSIWLSSSPDLIHWGSYRPVMMPGEVRWGMSKIGPTPPIKTKQGWLTIIHGVSRPCDGPHYHIGAMLLDLDEPWRVTGKTHSYLLTPEMDYETRGQVDNVVFPCGAIADHQKDELKLYYGAADTCICLATGRLSEVIQACLDEI